MTKLLFNFLYLLDLALNFLLLGDPSETVSSRTGRAISSGRPKRIARIFKFVVDNLFFFEHDHVRNSIELDEDFEHEVYSWIKKDSK